MDFLLDRSKRSPNFSSERINPRFVVLHYTACSLEKTFEIFLDPKSSVTSHFVISENGTVYDLGNFLESKIILKGAHAGRSSLKVLEENFEGFNSFSIGIELVNLNGNIFSYPEVQISSLLSLLGVLYKQFPQIAKADYLVGHEDIAGFRGKCDPGLLFPWSKVFQSLFPKDSVPQRKALMTKAEQQELLEYVASFDKETLNQSEFWPNLSLDLEKKLKTS